jgi:hypothetical protein
LVQGFQNQTSSVSIDSSTSKTLLQGIPFCKFQLTLTYPGNNIVQILVYSRLDKGYDFGVVICYVDNNIGSTLEDIFLQSHFEK